MVYSRGVGEVEMGLVWLRRERSGQAMFSWVVASQPIVSSSYDCALGNPVI